MSFEDYLMQIHNMTIEDFKQCGMGTREYLYCEYEAKLKEEK